MFNRLHRTIEHGFRWVETAAAVVAGCTILVVMALVTADGILRRVFGLPLTFQLQLTENYLLVILVMLALAWGFRKGGTIQVRLLVDVLPRAVADIVLRLGLIASAVYMTILAVLSWGPFYEALINHEVTMGVIDWPVAWSWVWVPLGCGLLAIRLTLDASAPELPTHSHHNTEQPGTEIM